MTSRAGRDFRVHVFDDDTMGWLPLEGERGSRVRFATDGADVTAKDTTPWRQTIDAAPRSRDLSATGIVGDGPAFGLVVDAAMTGRPIRLRVVRGQPSRTLIDHRCLISLRRTGTFNGAELFEIDARAGDRQVKLQESRQADPAVPAAMGNAFSWLISDYSESA